MNTPDRNYNKAQIGWDFTHDGVGSDFPAVKITTTTVSAPAISIVSAGTTLTAGIVNITAAALTTGCAIKITLAALTTGAAIDLTGVAATKQNFNVNSTTGSTAAPQTNAPTGFFKIGVAGTDQWVPYYSAS